MSIGISFPQNDDAKDIFDEDKWDDELYDYDYQDNDDIDYNNYIAEQIEVQAWRCNCLGNKPKQPYSAGSI